MAVFVCRFVEGIGSGLIEPIAQVMAMRSANKESMTSAVGQTELGRMLAYTIGPIIGGALYQFAGFYLPYCICGALYIMLSVWGFALMRPYVHRDYATMTTMAGPTTKINKCTVLLKIPAIAAIYVASFLGVAQSGYWEPTLQLYLAEKPYSLSPTLFGVLNGSCYFGIGVVSLLFLVPLMEKWLGASTTIIGGFLLMSAGAVIMGLPTLSSHAVSRHLSLVIVGYCILGMGSICAIIVTPSLTKQILNAHGHDATSPALVSATATAYVFVNLLGWCIGAVVGSAITEAKGLEFTFLVSAMVCLVVAPVLMLFLLPCAAGELRNKKKQEKE